ncbi:MAG: hypothetical protein CL578_22425 [Alteromonadaceae bacterium]|jgi:hypothetical protein|uniref:hypothetical protein n=1 Tax=unclassified Methylophaga TaxID=2629249 RepID=UPI000C56ACD4|nr:MULTISPECIES: hypothetical protein [unclassified Methylophaga]MBN27784.1 hypothetical protein [Alteromonadaceae bacterium]MAP27782.1 hypothetical protein [Methylophaga sp.]HAD31532.1 hypothetical protein [Methylophaga sp.]HBX59828.1 hypothetical protein [Methylophaga sp.]HCN99404.1 hypothetical protein [Methylophaga sp.]|tara:strand:- start:25125 stop:25862 length:738 start_codon:yes stop_codon:yes gene_type:complete
MSELTKEQFEQVPDFLKADYEQVGDVWKHAGMLKVKQTADNLDSKLKETNQRLSEFEKTQASAIEKARADALEEARSKGDVKAIEERYQQQMADLEKRVRQEAYDSARSEIKGEQAEKDASSIADKIGLALGVDEDAGYAIADLIRSQIKIDPDTGKEIYYDTKGSALSVDRNGYIAELKKQARLKRLIKGEQTTHGSGNANGSQNGGSAVNRKFNEMTGAELSALRKEDPAEYQRLKSQHYSNS